MVVLGGGRNDDRQVQFVPNSQAQVDIVEIHRKADFIEPAQTLEGLFANQQAGCCDRTLSACNLRKTEVACIGSMVGVASVYGGPCDIHHHAPMLNHAIAPQEFGSHGSYAWTD